MAEKKKKGFERWESVFASGLRRDKKEEARHKKAEKKDIKEIEKESKK